MERLKYSPHSADKSRRWRKKLCSELRECNLGELSSMFRVIAFLVALMGVACRGASVHSLAGCAIEYLNNKQIISSQPQETESFEDDCEISVAAEITKFYDEIFNLLESGVFVENLENENFVTHKHCIMQKLRDFNVSDVYLKGIAYHKLDRSHRSEHSFNTRMTSQQILALYALQLCDPRSFYARHAEKIFTLNMRTTNVQAYCLLNHLNANGADVSYQFSDGTAPVADFDSSLCIEVLRNFVRRYYNVIDRARSFSIFGLNPAKAMTCRASNDQNLINHMIFLTIFPRITFTPAQIEHEKTKFFDIARESAQSFFQCISEYD